MRIQCQTEATVSNLKLALDEDTGERVITPTFEFLVQRTEAELIFGKPLAELTFRGLEERGAWGYKAIKPAFFCEKHMLAIQNGERLATVPVIEKIEPSIGDRARVFVKTPFALAKREAVALVTNFGGGLRIDIEPAQMDLPLGQSPGAGVTAVVAASVKAMRAAVGPGGSVSIETPGRAPVMVVDRTAEGAGHA